MTHFQCFQLCIYMVAVFSVFLTQFSYPGFLFRCYSRPFTVDLGYGEKSGAVTVVSLRYTRIIYLSVYHNRYGGYGGIAYHHVCDKYIALFTHFITCGVWEAVYILDGLLKNLSDIQPDTLYADTQGQSGSVFAISYLLGIMSLAIQTLIAQGEEVNHRYIKALSPYITRHLKRYGDYVVNLHNIPQPLETAINLPPEIFEI